MCTLGMKYHICVVLNHNIWHVVIHMVNVRLLIPIFGGQEQEGITYNQCIDWYLLLYNDNRSQLFKRNLLTC